MMLNRFERAVERLVEGSIAGIFRLRVQPAEIGRRLERAMLDGRVASVGTTLAPNRFDVSLHPEDAAEFAGWEDALSREMETWLAELAYSRGLTTVGPILVEIVTDSSVSRRAVRASGRFEGGGGGAAARSGTGPELSRERPGIMRLLPAQPGLPALALAAAARTVGRAEDNDLVLLHAEISRRHARLEPHGAQWRVIDLGSTNGTWVNGERIRDAAIAIGDEVAFGGLRFTVGPG